MRARREIWAEDKDVGIVSERLAMGPQGVPIREEGLGQSPGEHGHVLLARGHPANGRSTCDVTSGEGLNSWWLGFFICKGDHCSKYLSATWEIK